MPPSRATSRLPLLVLCCAAAIGAARAAPPASTQKAVPDRQQQQKIEALRRAAVGPDPLAAAAAFDGLKEMGEPARKTLAAALRGALSQDKSALRRVGSSAGTATKLRAAVERVEEAREAARENVSQLAKGETLAKAHEYHKTLAAFTRELNDVCAAIDPAVRALARRPKLLEMYREADPAAAAREFPGEDESKLAAQVEKALGLTQQAAAAIPELDGRERGPRDDLSEPLARQLRFWRACRRVERYNVAPSHELLNSAERENLRLLNAYREALGLLPLELDARLVQSARRHTKEMAELGYFAHESPAPGQKSHGDRMKSAGYQWSFSGENIATGYRTGEEAFRAWFDSPGHHKNMAHPQPNVVGVGKWGTLWTQNFGRSKRLMLMDEAEREGVTVKGDMLKPQK